MGVKILMVAILVLLLITILAGIYFFNFSFVRRKPKYQGDYEEHCGGNFSQFETKMLEGKEWIHNHRDDRITITSTDGLQLVGYYIPSEETSINTILMMHGYRSDGYGDFSCLAKFFHENGYNLLIAPPAVSWRK